MVLAANRVQRDLRATRWLVQNLAEIEAFRFPMIDGLCDIQATRLTDHLIHGAEAEFGHVLTHFGRDEAEKILDEFRLTSKLRAQFGILRRNPNRTGIEMADAHHDAPHHHQRGGREAIFFGPE